jgi:hypothetical protein
MGVAGLGASVATGWGVATGGATTAMLAGSAGSVGGGLMAGVGAALASNPVGWAIAGVALVGSLVGLFGGGGKKKQEAAAERQRQLEQEAARAIEVVNERRSLMIELLRQEGRESEATALEREGALTQLDASNQDLQRQIWALSDASDAVAKAIAAADHAVEAANSAVEAAGRDLDTATSAVETARSSAEQVYQRDAAELQGRIDQMRGFAESLRAAGKAAGGGLSGPAVEAEFNRTANAAALGDPKALAKLVDLVPEFREAATAQARSAVDKARVDAKIRIATERAAQTADRQANIAEEQLAAETVAVQALGILNTNVTSLSDALTAFTGAVATMQTAQANLGTAQGNLGTAQTARGGLNFAAYTTSYPDLLQAALGLANAQGVTPDAGFLAKWGAEHYAEYGQGEGRLIPGFATGGMAQIGGSGPADSQLVRLSPGEFLAVSHEDPIAGMGDLAAQVRAMRTEMTGGLVQIARWTRRTAQPLRRWEGGGLPAERGY